MLLGGRRRLQMRGRKKFEWVPPGNVLAALPTLLQLIPAMAECRRIRDPDFWGIAGLLHTPLFLVCSAAGGAGCVWHPTP
jgi:hypothetical protein